VGHPVGIRPRESLGDQPPAPPDLLAAVDIEVSSLLQKPAVLTGAKIVTSSHASCTVTYALAAADVANQMPAARFFLTKQPGRPRRIRCATIPPPTGLVSGST
jgi:hypothetical protein